MSLFFFFERICCCATIHGLFSLSIVTSFVITAFKNKNQNIFFFCFEKRAIQKKQKKKRGSKSTSRCRLMLDNFKFHFRTPLTIISADSRRTQNNNSQFIFSSPKNWKMLLQMLLFFGWNCRRVSLFVCVRTSVDRHRAAAASPSCTWHPSHIPASFLLVHWSFSLHHLALDFQPMCVGFFSCPLSSGAAFRLKLWFAFHDMATCNHELLFKMSHYISKYLPCINHTLTLFEVLKKIEWLIDGPSSAVQCLSIVMLVSYIPLWGYTMS